ncbi:ATP-binding protein [Rhodoferax mekongensis]|uniref:ATP-binding protein n=1 Tax=Rhodoferax mekongensis TaxID=3068341 RepID=UPI0028BDD56E|nr:ATP-binding protein [Rhodoferax sp. TBRC 17199]MDT7516261.1 ATP-binding protein [Rhodoferax sp. TBRC 17199]
MRASTVWRARWTGVVARCVPDTLFGRLALLLGVAMLSSHVLALTLLFEMRPDVRPGLPPHAAPGPGGGPPPVGLILDVGVRLGMLLLAAWVAARWLSDPVRQLAGAARELGHNIHRPPLPETGSRECREATQVFNQMQQHICAQLEQRDQFVAAVSHDLRTPLTRLALRAESLGDEVERQRFAKDIAEMDAMIRATLDYLRGAAEAEPWVPLDMGSLVSSLAHDQQDCGHDVSVEATALQGFPPVRTQASALRRCLNNLLDNAVRYGGGAKVQLELADKTLRVLVRDRGPGIPEGELTKVLQPFYRVESSRNRHTGGVGLGLAAAHDIARQHGGSLLLRNLPHGGLEAELALPVI